VRAPFPVKLITRYVLREIGVPLVICIAALYLLLFGMQFLRASDVLLGSAVTLRDIGRVALYLTPHFLVMCLPVAFLLAVLLGLGRMNEDRELVALQAMGVSPWQLLSVPMAMGALLGGVMLLLSYTGEPWGLTSLERQVNEIIKKNILGDVKAGTFYEELPDFTLYVEEPDLATQTWERVLVHDDRDSASPLLVLARQGRVNPAGYSSALKLDLEDGEVHLANRAGEEYSVLEFERGEITLGVTETVFRKNRLGSARDQLTPGELWEAARVARQSGEDPRPFLVACHGRFAQTLAPMAFALLGGPLAMGRRVRGRSGGYFLTLAGYVAYYVLSRLFENFGAEGRLPIILAGHLTNVVFAGLGLLALKHLVGAGTVR
jgi:lipopolysaccharide export system permease protein